MAQRFNKEYKVLYTCAYLPMCFRIVCFPTLNKTFKYKRSLQVLHFRKNTYNR